MSSTSPRPPSRLLGSARRALALLAENAPALVVAAPALAWVWSATVRASWAALGRDQGIFQYLAWAVDQGEVVYRDVRDVNGPVITLVHLAFLALGGADEHRFRVLDLAVTGISFAAAGACLPSLAPRRATSDGDAARVGFASRAAWSIAAWVALSSQYLAYGFWDTAQRESFLDWFVLASIALQATRAADEGPSRRSTAILLAAGAASFVPWLGKPTYALFTASQLAAIAAGQGAWRARARRVATFLAGGALGLLGPLSFVALKGDLGRWARITFVDVPAMYRFIWPLPASTILSFPGYARTAAMATATTIALGLAIALGRLPRRAIPIAAMPVLGLASVLVQAKGFPYHFHPVTLGMVFGWLVGVHALWCAASSSARAVAWRAAAVVAAAIVGGRAALVASTAPFPPAPGPDERDPRSLESAERLLAFERVDFFPKALREAASFVAARTRPDDRVQIYAMDAYVLFLAQRRSATPYVHAYDLNTDAALAGSFDPEGPRPTESEAARIRAMRDEHLADLLARLERAPPAAFVFVDRSPLMSDTDSVADFARHCPDAARWLGARYYQAASFEGVRVWLQRP